MQHVPVGVLFYAELESGDPAEYSPAEYSDIRPYHLEADDGGCSFDEHIAKLLNQLPVTN